MVSAQTKSGTNQYMAAALSSCATIICRRATRSRSRSRSSATNGRLIPVTQWNQFGGSVGGPIKKNKLFYFGDYQGTRRNTGGSVLLRVPSLAERMGDLSGLGLQIYRSRQRPHPGHPHPFPGTIIPANRISPQASTLLKLIPAPNIAAFERPAELTLGSGAVNFNDDAFNTRVDWYATDKLHVFGRYSLANFPINSPGIYGAAGGPGLRSAAAATSAFAGHPTSLQSQRSRRGFDYVLRPNLFTDFRFGWFRYQVLWCPTAIGTSPPPTPASPA